MKKAMFIGSLLFALTFSLYVPLPFRDSPIEVVPVTAWDRNDGTGLWRLWYGAGL